MKPYTEGMRYRRHRACLFFFSSRSRHTRYIGDWSSDVCSSDLSSGTVSARIYALEEQIRALTVPLLVIVGEHDDASLKPSRFLAEHAPNAELAVMPGAGDRKSVVEGESGGRGGSASGGRGK